MNYSDFSFAGGKKWFPTTKGGKYRKWYGNHEYVVNWENDGREIKNFKDTKGKLRSRPQNLSFYFKEGITWNDIAISPLSGRFVSQEFISNAAGPMIFEGNLLNDLCMLNSSVNRLFTSFLAPTFHYEVGAIALIPVMQLGNLEIEKIGREAIRIAKEDRDSFETPWDFQTLPVLQQKTATLAQSQAAADAEVFARFQRMKQLEEDNNRLFIEAYGLRDELSPEVPEEQITLARPDREEDIKRLISYAIGCIMGRYSLDKPGLIYAHNGNQGFDHEIREIREKKTREGLSCDSCFSWFEPDPDGIVPIMDSDWFSDDAANRFVEFITLAWPKEHLEESLTFVAESLGTNRGEQPRDTIRRYLAQSFFKDHLKTYKRRPIYWLFSSGKQRAFQCLVSLHRYNEGTLSRVRTEYVIPLQGKLNARIEHLTNDALQATSTSHRKKLEKEQDALRKQQAELLAFDEKLRHSADMRISLHLDDGVKVNYGKFGDLLAEVKAVCGKEED